MVDFRIIVDLGINEICQTGAVRNRTYRVGVNAVRLETEPTGSEINANVETGSLRIWG